MKKLRSIWDFQSTSKSFRVAYLVDQLIPVQEVMERTGASRDLVLGVVRKIALSREGAERQDRNKVLGLHESLRRLLVVPGVPAGGRLGRDADTGESRQRRRDR